MGLCFLRKVTCHITLIPRILPVPVIEAGAGHALAQAALFQEILFQSAELLVNEVVGLMNQADGDVGDDFWWADFHEFAVQLVGLRDFASQPADVQRLAGVLIPFRAVAYTE